MAHDKDTPEATPDCPYCGSKAQLIDSKEYYGNGKSYGMMYVCWPCDATVGVHKDSGERFVPKGSLANRELRELRKQCHALFDSLWRGSSKKMTRKQAYKKLADNMGMNRDEAHIGKFRETDCRRMLRVFAGRV